MGSVVSGFTVFDALIELREFGCLTLAWDQHPIFPFANVRFPDVGKERTHGIKIVRSDGIEFVIVALGAADSLAEPNGADSADAIGEHAGFVVLCLRAAFFCSQKQTI